MKETRESMRLSELYLLVFLGTILFIPITAAAEKSQATIDDYVWKVLEPARNSNYFDNKCEYESLVSYRKCLRSSLQTHDNQLSKRWGLKDYVVREKDTLYIEVPNRTFPLAFRDEQYFIDAQSHSYFSLYDYDKSRQLLYLLRSFPEGESTILIDLKTGFSQEFYGIDTNVSPDQNRIASVERYEGAENITILEKLDNTSDADYKIVYESEVEELKKHLAFYQDESRINNLEDIDIKWQDNNTVIVDFYYLINTSDDVGYRVRFKVNKPNQQSDWQLIPIK